MAEVDHDAGESRCSYPEWLAAAGMDILDIIEKNGRHDVWADGIRAIGTSAELSGGDEITLEHKRSREGTFFSIYWVNGNEEIAYHWSIENPIDQLSAVKVNNFTIAEPFFDKDDRESIEFMLSVLKDSLGIRPLTQPPEGPVFAEQLAAIRAMPAQEVGQDFRVQQLIRAMGQGVLNKYEYAQYLHDLWDEELGPEYDIDEQQLQKAMVQEGAENG